MNTPVMKTERLDDSICRVNKETGEVVPLDNTADTRYYRKSKTGDSIVPFGNYVATDTAANKYVCSILTATEYKYYHLMAGLLHTPFNMLYTKNHRPHTLKTLAEELKLSEDQTRRFIRTFEENDLVVWSVFADSGYPGKIFMFNPYVVRKRETFNNEMLALFPDLRKVAKSAISTEKRSLTKLPATLDQSVN
jgi:hypothetical protein